MLDIDEIKACISQFPFVKNIIDLEWRDHIICGIVEIDLDELEKPLEFEVKIRPQYPLQSYGFETIKFINKSLIEYNHVMGDGSICIHTSHDVNVKEKLTKDFYSLKNWIVKYYINKGGDSNYEHIIVPESLEGGQFTSYLFTDVDHEFKEGEFGYCDLSRLNVGTYRGKPILNLILQRFRCDTGESYECKWSKHYKDLGPGHEGIFVFVKRAPALYNRFVLRNWLDLVPLLDQNFLSFLHKVEKRNLSTHKGKKISIFIGYKTIGSEIHWQVAILEIGKFPLEGIPERILGTKTGKWKTRLVDRKISWALTRNCSYDHFFGRGTLTNRLRDAKILILGVGAIGSILAVNLVRGGCKSVDLADYDVKEPENVCRSEYLFGLGLSDKDRELTDILNSISPFVEIASFKTSVFGDVIKELHKVSKVREVFETLLNQYDLIFDCTTDNDLMHVLNSLNLTCDLINLSITNHAKELICAFYPNIYNFVINQYTNVLENDHEDLYKPTGCWSPTFRASYNDINVLVQVAVKNINLLFEKSVPKNNFVLKTNTDSLFKVEIEEY